MTIAPAKAILLGSTEAIRLPTLLVTRRRNLAIAALDNEVSERLLVLQR